MKSYKSFEVTNLSPPFNFMEGGHFSQIHGVVAKVMYQLYYQIDLHKIDGRRNRYVLVHFNFAKFNSNLKDTD